MKNPRGVRAAQRRDFSGSRSREWIDNEVVGCEFEDVRHGKRLRQLLEQFSGRIGSTTPWASEDWANTKAAYRFFGNERISEANILAGHFGSTRECFAASPKSPVLILHDTTELSYRHENSEPIGIIKKIPAGPPRPGRPHLYTSCGILMHSSLVITHEGQPLGLAAIKFWSRDKFHGAPGRLPEPAQSNYGRVCRASRATGMSLFLMIKRLCDSPLSYDTSSISS